MTASTDAAASFAFDQPPVLGRPAFLDGRLSCRQKVRRTLHARSLRPSRCPAPASSGNTTCGRRSSARRVFSLVKVDSVSGYDIEMMDDPDLVLLHILMRGNAQLQQGAAKVEVAPAQMVVLEGMGRSHKRWYGTTQQLLGAR